MELPLRTGFAQPHRFYFYNIFFPDEKNSGLKRQGTFTHFYALSSCSCTSNFSRESIHCTCSALPKFQICGITLSQTKFLLDFYFFFFSGAGIPPFPEFLGSAVSAAPLSRSCLGSSRRWRDFQVWRAACVKFAKHLEILWGERCYVNVRSLQLSGVQMHPGLW